MRWIIARIPYSVYKFLSSFFYLIGHAAMLNKRKIAFQSLNVAYAKEKTQDEINEIANKCFNNFGRGMIELTYLIDRPELIKEKVKIIGKENLDQVLSQGNGAILVSAHYGSFILMYLRMVLAGYETNVIMRRTRDTEWEKYISKFRDERGIKTIYDLPARQCVTGCIRALRKNELLFILNDQNYGSDGRIFVDFFGKKAATAAGPIVFSNRTKAPILPIFILRNEDGENVIHISPAISLEHRESADEEMAVNVQKITKIIEDQIRESPEEWGGWMHKRWKSQIADPADQDSSEQKEVLQL